MATPHNQANKGDFAKTVLMPGDPLRAKFIVDTFLEDVKLVNEVRNMLGYTGKYKGVPVSVMASGMGMPSIGIYSYELYKFYDVDNIIRIGSSGSYTADLDVLDVVLAKSAYSDSTFARMQSGEESNILKPSEKLNAAILSKAKELNIPCKEAVVHSADVFYVEDSLESFEDIRKRTGSDCVEMESFALFHNANVLHKNAACLLTISDSFVSKKEISADQRQIAFKDMMRLALETAIDL